jgi:Dehydrogenase E1 component
MTADATASGAAFDNPLMPNARLRQIYLAMVKARTLGRTLPRKRTDRPTSGLEACLVSPTIDLGPGDLVSDVLNGGVIDFLRGVTLTAVLQPKLAAKKRGVRADCGAAGRLTDPADTVERMWAALGAAAALKALAANAKAGAAEDNTAKQPAVLVLYVLMDRLPAALLRKSLTFAREKALPVLFVVLPSAPAKSARRTASSVSSTAQRCGVPGIPVDAHDAVAIYRVAQESIGHARIGGGPALIEAMPYVAESNKKRAPAHDPISCLEQYILQRGVATRSWMDREAAAFAKQVEAAKAASK